MEYESGGTPPVEADQESRITVDAGVVPEKLVGAFGGGTTAATAIVELPVAVAPAAFVAITVHVPVPAPEVDTTRLPDVPTLVPAAAPVHATLAEIAFAVVHEKLLVAPAVTAVGLNEVVRTEGGATTVKVAVAGALAVPIEFVAVTAQDPAPVPLDFTTRLPEVPEDEPAAVPLHATVADVALAVAQEKVELAPVVTIDGENAAAVTEGAASTVIAALPVAVVPAALAAVTVQVPAPAPLVVTARLPDVPEAVPAAVPLHVTVADVAFAVVHEKVLEVPAVTDVALNAAVTTDGAATTLSVAATGALTVPTELVAVTAQDPAPVPLVVTTRLPERPVVEPAAVPLQATAADVAFAVVQLNVECAPVVTVDGLKGTLVTDAGATADVSVSRLPAASSLYATLAPSEYVTV